MFRPSVIHAQISQLFNSCVPADAVIQPWTDGKFQVVDRELKLI
ncbi:hypothetical protein AVEN_237498-1, partial [Araneus ventricosus]